MAFIIALIFAHPAHENKNALNCNFTSVKLVYYEKDGMLQFVKILVHFCPFIAWGYNEYFIYICQVTF